jgi:uncharacterized protein (TIGR00725 family)
MEAAACGAKNEGGLTIGIIPKAVRELEDNDKDEWPNRFVDVAIFTGLGGGINGDREDRKGRNVVIVNSCDAMIALPGTNNPHRGTRSEINFAIKNGTPVVLDKYWRDVQDPGPPAESAERPRTVRYFTEADAEDAVNMALEAIEENSHRRHKTTVRR